ncbi:hypothetical protein Tco_1403243 [Tanacetum coccineum]
MPELLAKWELLEGHEQDIIEAAMNYAIADSLVPTLLFGQKLVSTLHTPNANASDEEDEAEELIVVPTAVKHTTVKVRPRMSSTNSKAEDFLEKNLDYLLKSFYGIVDLKSKLQSSQSFNKPQKGYFCEASYDDGEETNKISTALQDKVGVDSYARRSYYSLGVQQDREKVTPKTSHLNAVKRIFKYLKGKPNLGLWYPRESSFDLEAFSDSDYAGANLDRKSTTGGCQFLGSRLISWQCKKQTIVATSTTEAEYVAAASCCGQVLWIQNQMLDYGFNFMNTKIHIDNESTICIVKNPVYHSKTKHIEIRHHFIRDSYEKKLIRVEKIHTDFNVADLLTKAFDGPRFKSGRPMLILLIITKNHNRSTTMAFVPKHNQVGFLKKPEGSAGFEQIVDFLKGTHIRYALEHNPTIYVSVIKQFWQTVTVITLDNGEQELKATIDTHEYTISESSVRNKLKLADENGITEFTNAEIFEGMANLGYPIDNTFTFWKKHFTPNWKFMVHHILHCISSKSGGWDQFGSKLATALICLSTRRTYNFSKMIFEAMVANVTSQKKFLMYPRFLSMILEAKPANTNLYLAYQLTKKIFGNMNRGFAGVNRPLLANMIAGHDDNQELETETKLHGSSSDFVHTPPTQVETSSLELKSISPEPMEHTYDQPQPSHVQQPASPEPQPTSPPKSPPLQGPTSTYAKATRINTTAAVIVKLIKRVKKLETRVKYGNLPTRKMVLSDSDSEDASNSSKQ